MKPGTVIRQLSRLLLCSGRRSKTLIDCVRRNMPLPPTFAPVMTPPVVMSAAPPVPAKNVPVPLMPTVVNAAPRPAPMTGASKPALSPMTRPPPSAARPIIA